MNIFYFSTVRIDDLRMNGVNKKITGQLKVFENNFENCYYTNTDRLGLNIYCKDDLVKRIKWDIFFIKKIAMVKSFYKEVLQFISHNNIDVIYIRKNTSTPFFISFIKSCKQMGLKIFIEIPTYPYEKEINNKIVRIIDKYYSSKMKKHTDKIVTYSKDALIFGVDTIRTANGIEASSILNSRNKREVDHFSLIGVANVSDWHGYDRVINGLHNYYKKGCTKKIYFNIVGEGIGIDNLKELAKKLSVEEYIVFHGAKTGKELDDVYAKSHVGVGSLGMHRIGLVEGSTLKLREYCAKGIPFIYAYNDADFDNFIYAKKFGNDNNSLDIEMVLKFYYLLDDEKIFNDIQAYALKNLTWESKMKEVIKIIRQINVN